MIPAEKSRFVAGWLARDAASRIRRSFQASYVRGITTMRERLAAGPVLVVSNHTSWWDPIVLQYLCTRVLGADAYAMMDAKNLERLAFFKKVGAFGVDLEDPRDGVRAMRYAAKLLDRPGRLVWIFPQGREVPITQRPLGFRPGSAVVARFAKKACVVPAALRYEMGKDPLPYLWATFGDPSTRDAHDVAVEREMDRLDRAILTGDAAGYDVLHARSESLGFRFAQAALSWLMR